MSKKSTPKKNWREERRMQAWKLHEKGWKQKDIAEALGVTEGAVSQWLKKAKAQGVQALRHQPPPGAQPKLSPEQQAQLPALLAKGAEAFGFRGQVWTTARVAEMIKQQFGVSYHRAHCSRLLGHIKYRLQKPRHSATQCDEAAIQTWKEERWPALKKVRGGKTDHRLCRSVRLLSIADGGPHLRVHGPDAHLAHQTDA